jgi:hypothetical protein
MNTIELIEDATLFGGNVPNDRIKEVRDFINDLKSKALNIQNVSPCCYLNELLYYKENEGTAKTFRNIRTEKWYYEAELAEIIGKKNIDRLKSNKG